MLRSLVAPQQRGRRIHRMNYYSSLMSSFIIDLLIDSLMHDFRDVACRLGVYMSRWYPVAAAGNAHVAAAAIARNGLYVLLVALQYEKQNYP